MPDRRLAVLLHADIMDSTALVRRNETVAHQRIRATFGALGEVIAGQQGKVHEIRGDALVAEFARVSDAVNAAMSFQASQASADADGEDSDRPRVRIGIAMGEVVIADGTVTGEGIVLAHRLEQLAEAGGVRIQAAAYETLPKWLPFCFENLGERALKGFEAPVRVYAVRGEAMDDPVVRGQDATTDSTDFPSIAVLPFVNVGGDANQDYLAEGIAEDIITALSKISSLAVIARSSSFTYRGRAVDIRQVGREQGVRYVLEGSVRRSGDRIRVIAQLGDAHTGHQVWAERYDRRLDDIFGVQDELMREIVVSLDVTLREGEQHRMWSSGTDSVEAWELVRLSTPAILGNVQHDLPRARQRLERALAIDPEYAIAWTMMGWYHQNFVDVASGITLVGKRAAALKDMHACVARAIDIDPQCADAYSVMAMYHMELRQFDEALECALRSVDYAPGNAENLAEAAMILIKCGRPREALEMERKAMRLCPMYRAGFLRGLASAYRFCGEAGKAADTLAEAVRRQPEQLSGHVNLASVLGELGRLEEARAAAADVLRLSPGFTIGQYANGLAYRREADLSQVVNGLRAAGLPD